MKRQKRLTRNQRHNLAVAEAQAQRMERALTFNPIPVDFETISISGRMGSSQPNLQYIPIVSDYYSDLKDALFEHKHLLAGLPPPRRSGAQRTVYIIDDELRHTDYAALERRTLALQLLEHGYTAHKTLLLSSYGEDLPEEHTELFKKMVEDATQMDAKRTASKMVSFASNYATMACKPLLRCHGGKINGVGPATGLGSPKLK